jgi:oligoendopeptidase F
LRSGSSDYPLELLKKAGVDLTTPKPVQDAMNVFKNALDEFEALI